MKHRSKQKLSPLQEKRVLRITVALVVVAFLWVLFSPGAGIFALLKNRSELKRLRGETITLEEENVRLQKVIDRLQNDTEYLEEIARGKYGLVRKNELIYDFSRKKPVSKE